MKGCTKSRIVRYLSLLLIVGMLTGCGAPVWVKPIPPDKVEFMSRAESMTQGGVTVTVAVPSREETEALFGTSLYNDLIQPVWIEVDNQSQKNYILMKVGVDRMGFSPLEASYQRHSGDKATRLDMDRFFYSMDFKNPVMAGTVNSGFVFTNLDEGHKAIHVDLVGNNDLKAYSFVIQIPGIVTDASLVDFANLYDNWVEISDEKELRKTLEGFPCCTVNKDGSDRGDPLNIVMIGDSKDVFSALIRSGWHQTEVTHGASIMKTVRSFLFGRRYRYSPISPLYVFGRQQDLGMQKARSSITLRNHMRLWRTRYNYHGKAVFLGQISRDIGVKFNARTITTHVIDPDVDDTRNSLVGDLAYSQNLVKLGYVAGSQVSTMRETHYNLTPDPYYSDGLRAVMFFVERPITLDQIEILDWEKTHVHTIQ